jgi:hypothetical protein
MEGLMLCIACGERMILFSSVPDHRMMVPSYEHQTFQCSACGEAECRLIFKPAKSPLGSSADKIELRKQQEPAFALPAARRWL